MNNENAETIDQIISMLNCTIKLLSSLTDSKYHEITKAPVENNVMLTIKECMELIDGLSEYTLRQLIAQKKIKSYRSGEGIRGKILVNKASLLDYFNGNDDQ